MTDASPQQLVDALAAWAASQEWVDWLEVGGSLGRDAGDELSDVDAGLGVTGALDAAVGAAEAAITAFGPVAGTLRQEWQGSTHLVVGYDDGRQLSLVVLPADARTGLPPQARALLDRSGRLATALPDERWTPAAGTVREWAFLAWVAVGDAARHAHRGHPWRALRSLTEGRDLVWQLWAARLGLTFPQFGAVTVENAGAPAPDGMAATHPASLERATLLRAARALADVLAPLSPADLGRLAASVQQRLALLG